MGNEISNAAATDASASSSHGNASFQVCSHCAAIITDAPPPNDPRNAGDGESQRRERRLPPSSRRPRQCHRCGSLYCAACASSGALVLEKPTEAAVESARNRIEHGRGLLRTQPPDCNQQYRRRWRCAANPLCRFKHRGVAGSGAGSHAGGRAVRDRIVRTAAGKHARRTGAGARARASAAAITGDISDAQAVNDALKDEDAEDSIAAVPVRRPLRDHGTSSGAPAVPGAAATANAAALVDKGQKVVWQWLRLSVQGDEQDMTSRAASAGARGGGVHEKSGVWQAFDKQVQVTLEAARSRGCTEAKLSLGLRPVVVNFGTMTMVDDVAALWRLLGAESGVGEQQLDEELRGELDAAALNAVAVRRKLCVGKEHFQSLRTLGAGAGGKVLLVRRCRGRGHTSDCSQQAVAEKAAQTTTTSTTSSPAVADADAPHDEGRLYAMKVIRKDGSAANWAERLWTERNILANLNHPFLTQLRYAFQSCAELFLVMDLYQGGELFFHLARAPEGRFSEARSRFYAAELLMALEHLHKHDIVYRDLKPENVLLDRQGHVRVTDFGLSKRGGGAGLRSFVGSPEYLAPEVLLAYFDRDRLSAGYGKAADWWAFGTLLFEMLTGRPPFHHENHQLMYRAILRESAPLALLGPMLADASSAAHELLAALLVKDQDKRLGTHICEGDHAEKDEPCGRRDSLGGEAGESHTPHSLPRIQGAHAVREHPFFGTVDWGALLRRETPAPFVPDVRHDADLRNFDVEFEPDGADGCWDNMHGTKSAGEHGPASHYLDAQNHGKAQAHGHGEQAQDGERQNHLGSVRGSRDEQTSEQKGRFKDFSFVRPPSLISNAAGADNAQADAHITAAFFAATPVRQDHPSPVSHDAV